MQSVLRRWRSPPANRTLTNPEQHLFEANRNIRELIEDTSVPAVLRAELATEFDEITAAAALETDSATRVEMYAQAEELLAAEEAAYAPIYHYATMNTTKPWLTRNFMSLGNHDFLRWEIDQAAQLEALGGSY